MAGAAIARQKQGPAVFQVLLMRTKCTRGYHLRPRNDDKSEQSDGRDNRSDNDQLSQHGPDLNGADW
jgi:hypothetical protein